jgi:L-threonylcarbamoyladenylate synthase
VGDKIIFVSMEIIDVTKSENLPLALAKAMEALRSGEVVMHATETCYGLAADIFDEKALQRVYDIKKMPLGKPVSLMVQRREEAEQYAEFGDLAMQLAEEFWPGPLTLILPRLSSLPPFFNAGHSTVGVRCPDHDISQLLVEKFGSPLTTTSANITTVPEVYTVQEFMNQLDLKGKRPALILDSGLIEKNPPSTIVALSENGPQIVRRGAIAKRVEEFLGLE